MRRPTRRGGGPAAEVLTRAGLSRGEKVLAASESEAGQWLLGTHDRLVVLGPDVEPTVLSVRWERVQRVEWDRDDARLRVTEVGEYGEPVPRHEFVVPEPGDLLALVRERVTASVVLQRRVAVDPRKGLLVTARRPPRGGEIAWAYELDEGLDPADPDVAATAERGLRLAQEELGL